MRGVSQEGGAVWLSEGPMDLPKSASREEESLQWYAVYTHCRHEARVEAALRHTGVEAYLPWTTTPSCLIWARIS